LGAASPLFSGDCDPEVQREVFALVETAEGRTIGVQRLERYEFYRRAAAAFAVVATSELRPYGCVLPTQGVF
jgi:L-fucose mutarotase